MQDNAPLTELLSRVLEARVIECSLQSVSLRGKVKISVPELTHYPRRMWADWGRMYFISTNKRVEIGFSYEDPLKNKTFVHTTSPEMIRIKSPISEKHRKVTPLFLELIDESSGLLFQCFYNPQGDLISTQALPFEQPAKVIGGEKYA